MIEEHVARYSTWHVTARGTLQHVARYGTRPFEGLLPGHQLSKRRYRDTSGDFGSPQFRRRAERAVRGVADLRTNTAWECEASRELGVVQLAVCLLRSSIECIDDDGDEKL